MYKYEKRIGKMLRKVGSSRPSLYHRERELSRTEEGGPESALGFFRWRLPRGAGGMGGAGAGTLAGG